MRGVGSVLLAEWTKFRTLRSSRWLLICAAVITIALGVSLLLGIVERYDAMTAAERADLDPAGEGIWYHGLHLGQVLIAVLGVLLATGEFATGTIRTTLAAVPARQRVFAAKTVGFAGLSFVVGLVVALVTFVVAQPILAGRGLDVALTDPVALRGVVLAGVVTAGTALIGVGTGVLIRHTAGAVTTLLVVMLGIPIVGQFFPDDWKTALRYVPPEPGWAMFAPADSSLALTPATAIFLVWVAVIVAGAAVAFQRRDV